jgi:carboxyl-terminal processing protease
MVSRRQEIVVDNRRMPTSLRVVALLLLLGIGYIAGTFHTQIFSAVGSVFGIRSASSNLDLSSLQDTYRALAANYDGTIDTTKLVEGANRGLVDALGDEYTLYMNKQEAAAFDDDLNGTVGGGIGVEIGKRSDLLTVVRILKDNPAEKAGVMTGDILISVNDEAVDSLTIEEAVKKIRGEAGTTVKLTVLRDGATKEFTITRAEVNNPSVYTSVENGLGIMTITRFDDQTGALARAAALSFKEQGVKGVVLDLRGNGGGYIEAAKEVASLWLDNKMVVSERTNGKTVDELRTGSNPILGGVKTVVVVDGSSASASEIVAGALQDNKAATLVGVKTFCKGSVQKLIALTEGAELKVTVARWYTPNGVNISKQGITPTTIIGITQEDINADRDPQLDAAKGVLQ